MRQRVAHGFKVEGTEEGLVTGVNLRGNLGELVRVIALDHDIFRVQFCPSGKPTTDRSYALLPPSPTEDVSYIGDEHLCSAFSLPKISVNHGAGYPFLTLISSPILIL